jgi:hypothetical protein
MVVKIAFGTDIMYSEMGVSNNGRSADQFTTLASISNSIVTLPKETQERFKISPEAIPDGYNSWEEYFDCYKEMKKNMEKL